MTREYRLVDDPGGCPVRAYHSGVDEPLVSVTPAAMAKIEAARQEKQTGDYSPARPDEATYTCQHPIRSTRFRRRALGHLASHVRNS